MAGNVFSDKAAARRQLEAVRRALPADTVARWGGEAQRRLAALPVFGEATTVALYAAQSFEVPTAALHAALTRAGKLAVYPRVVKKGQPLVFAAVAKPDDLVPARFGLVEPAANALVVDPEEIDLFVVPGVGFTRDGVRLGRGGGFYDLTLPQARTGAGKVALAFAVSVVEALPRDPTDVLVDSIVTEAEVIDCWRQHYP